MTAPTPIFTTVAVAGTVYRREDDGAWSRHDQAEARLGDLEASRMLDEQAVHEQALNDDDAVWDALADQRTADEAAWHEAQTAEESEEMSQGPADRADT